MGAYKFEILCHEVPIGGPAPPPDPDRLSSSYPSAQPNLT